MFNFTKHRFLFISFYQQPPFYFFLRFNITLKRFFTRKTLPSQYKIFSTLTDNNAIFCIIFLFTQANYK